MASSEEDMYDNFEEGEEGEASPTPYPLDINPINNVDSNKAKPLLEEYRETRIAEETAAANERSMLESRIRAIVSANPKIEIGKPSHLQEKLSEMTVEQLRFALQSAEDQLGISNPFGISKALLQLFDYGLQSFAGRKLNPDVYTDCQFLSSINRVVPNMTHQYQEPILMATKAIHYVSTTIPVITITTPDDMVTVITDPVLPNVETEQV
jgi:hypothetical protein